MSRARFPGLVAVILGFAGCGAGQTEPLPGRLPPKPRAAEAQREALPAAAGTAAADENIRAVEAALTRVAQLRALPAKGPVNSRTLARATIAERVRAHIAREVPETVVRGSTELLIGLGVVPTDFDYVGSILAFMSSELAGLYEPDDDTMYLAEDLAGAEREATLMHELVHALQDQHYDLGSVLDYRPDQGDRQAAVHSLAEGDATSLMLDAMLAGQGASALDMPENVVRMQILGAVELSLGVTSVPPIIRRSAVAPYLDGLALVHALRRQGGWNAVDQAWQHPPESTEQLLHPEKLASREAPEQIPLPGAPGSSWTLLFSDVLGEQAYRLLFEEWVPARTAKEAAAGWGGDRVAVYTSGDDYLIAARVRWDDETSAIRGHEVTVRGALGGDTREAAREALKGGAVCVERADRGPLAVHRRGRDVGIVGGPFRHSGSATTSRGTCVTARAAVMDVVPAPHG